MSALNIYTHIIRIMSLETIISGFGHLVNFVESIALSKRSCNICTYTRKHEQTCTTLICTQPSHRRSLLFCHCRHLCTRVFRECRDSYTEQTSCQCSASLLPPIRASSPWTAVVLGGSCARERRAGQGMGSCTRSACCNPYRHLLAAPTRMLSRCGAVSLWRRWATFAGAGVIRRRRRSRRGTCIRYDVVEGPCLSRGQCWLLTWMAPLAAVASR